MGRKRTKASVLKETCQVIGLPVSQMEQLPRILGQLARKAATPPCVVSFAFDPGTGQILQVSVSDFPKVVKAYSALARATMSVAGEFQRKVQEELDGAVEGLEANAEARGDVKPGNGGSATGPKVGESAAQNPVDD